MIPKDQRFNMRVEFLDFKKHAKITRSPHFTLYSQSSDLPLLAVVIPKKLHKSAATRNIFKRSFKKIISEFASKNPVKLVVIVKPIVQNKSALLSLAKELQNSLSKLPDHV